MTTSLVLDYVKTNLFDKVKDEFIMESMPADNSKTRVATDAALRKYIPIWHKGTDYNQEFFILATHLLKMADIADLARYLKVIGFEEIQVTRNEAADLIAVRIIAAKKNGLYLEKSAAEDCCSCFDERLSSKHRNMLTSKGRNSQLLLEVLCCMEGVYRDLKTQKDEAYEKCCTDPGTKPVFGKTPFSDCGPMQYQVEGGCCKKIPMLLIPLFEDVEKSLASGKEIIQNIFLNKLHLGSEKAAELEFTFKLTAYIQYKFWLKLTKGFHELLTTSITSKMTRFFVSEEAGVHSNRLMVLDAMKKIMKHVIKHGKFQCGTVENVIAVCGTDAEKEDPSCSAKDSDGNPKKKKIVRALTNDSQRLALWFACHLTLMFQSAKTVKNFVFKRLESFIKKAVEGVEVPLSEQLRAIGSTMVSSSRSASTEEFMTKKAYPIPKAAELATWIENVAGENPDWACSNACTGIDTSRSWEFVRKENHDLIESIVVDGISNMKGLSGTPCLGEAIVLITKLLKDSMDYVTEQSLEEIQTLNTPDQLLAVFDMMSASKRSPAFRKIVLGDKAAEFFSEHTPEDTVLDEVTKGLKLGSAPGVTSKKKCDEFTFKQTAATIEEKQQQAEETDEKLKKRIQKDMKKQVEQDSEIKAARKRHYEELLKTYTPSDPDEEFVNALSAVEEY